MPLLMRITLVLCLSCTLVLDASAGKRLGGGKTLGTAPSHQQSAPSKPAAQSQTPAPTPAATNSSRWLGPLAGIAAGGLLAALFLGDAFQGIQVLDVLLLALLAFVLFRLLAARRQPLLAGGGLARETSAVQGFSSSGGLRPIIHAPAWFHQERFIAQGKAHFLALQQHWDANELGAIAEFFTPAMMSILTQERAQLGDAPQSTYIDALQVQLDGLEEHPHQTVATLTFSGLVKESRFATGTPFSESWRLERATGADHPWLVAGIRQNLA